MDSKRSLDALLGYLNHPYTSKEKRKAFWKECEKNINLEKWCLAACEIGELGSESVANYILEMKDFNTPGLIGGITLGLFYALWDVYKHGRKHSKNASLRDAFGYAMATESACVFSATGVEYGLGLAVSQPPLSPFSLIVRGIGLIPAFALGLTAMSALTYFHNREAGRFLAQGKALSLVYDYMKGFDNNNVVSLGKDLKIRGTKSLVVSEHRVPKSLVGDCPDDSLYVIKSPVCRYDLESRMVMRDTVGDFFRGAGFEVQPVQNIFRH